MRFQFELRDVEELARAFYDANPGRSESGIPLSWHEVDPAVKTSLLQASRDAMDRTGSAVFDGLSQVLAYHRERERETHTMFSAIVEACQRTWEHPDAARAILREVLALAQRGASVGGAMVGH